MLRFEFADDTGHKDYARASELYRMSFPPHEQREQSSQDKIMADAEYRFVLIYDEDVFVGLILYWETPRFIYVEHFCIVPDMRNKGYGREALSFVGGKRKTVILEIDPPTDDISVRRKGFYERCGYADNRVEHVHPPYRRGDGGHALSVMSYPRPLSDEEYVEFQTYLHERVMKRAF